MKLRKSAEEKQAEAVIKSGVKLYFNDALAAMSHTQGCSECETKFNSILEHAGGQLKSVTHIPGCETCQKLFSEIVNHTKESGKVLENKDNVSV